MTEPINGDNNSFSPCVIFLRKMQNYIQDHNDRVHYAFESWMLEVWMTI